MVDTSLTECEWLEVDGLGGFASGTGSGIRTRRYHGLLLTASSPPTGRLMLINGADVGARTPSGTFALSSHRYGPDVLYPDGAGRIRSFQSEPWPQWRFVLEDGTEIEQSLFVPHGRPMVVMRWRVRAGDRPVSVHVRLLLSGRHYHALHRENPHFQFEPYIHVGRVTWQPYHGLPSIVALTNGRYEHEPVWYRNFLYEAERDRGLDHLEDLASPGTFSWDLGSREAVLLCTTDAERLPKRLEAAAYAKRVEAAERRRRAAFPTPLHRAADAYVATSLGRGNGRGRDAGMTVIAGYPWFTDWGRDTFIAMRGLCLAVGRLDVARRILLAWADAVSEGMVPNRFPDEGTEPEYNSVDASLWYVVAAYEYLEIAARVRGAERQRLIDAVETIVTRYAKGTRYRIGADADGLLAAGEPGLALTWMDARVDGRPVTPRLGKPVEVQALWVNALLILEHLTKSRPRMLDAAQAAFSTRFWNSTAGFLYDVVDVDHQPGRVDAAMRPNQILAVGGLPFPIVSGPRARQIVESVEARLWTPLGLRTLAPDAPGYVGHYRGGVPERDAAYHQGTVWPWLAGPFIEAWVQTHGGTGSARAEACRRFLPPLEAHLKEAGLGHVSELTDGEPPFRPAGCPFQAWSLGELLRVRYRVLGEPPPVRRDVPRGAGKEESCGCTRASRR